MEIIKLVLQEGSGSTPEVATYGFFNSRNNFAELGASIKEVEDVLLELGLAFDTGKFREAQMAECGEALPSFVDMRWAAGYIKDRVPGDNYEAFRYAARSGKIPGTFDGRGNLWLHRASFERWVSESYLV